MSTTLKNRIRLFSFVGILLFLNACSNLKIIDFDTPVDTTNKTITKQVKQIYSLNDLGIYASNDFDGAHLNGFQKENDSTAILIINPENIPINNSAYYAFKTWSDTPKVFYYKFQYPKGYKHRYIPKIRINNNWSIIDSTSIFKKDSIVTIKLNLTKEVITIAAQEVQSSLDVFNWYSDLARGKQHIVSIKSAGKSTLGRNLPVLDIGLGDKKGKEIIVLLTRQHPPEVTGFFAYQYFVETLLNGSELSNNFLSRYRVLAFPIMNPDGVDLGHWRHNAGGVDLNRDWSVYNQPEIKQTVKFINKAVKKSSSKLILGLDFHSTWYDVFYTNKERKNTTLPQFNDDWFKALENNIPNYKVNDQPGKSTRPVSKGWFLYAHNATGITYEIGDKTSKDSIKQISRISAEQMMRILLNK